MISSDNEKAAAGTDLLQEHNNCFVVGLGASAGGLQALTEFFDAVPADSGIAYVVILHLSPDYESRLREVLLLHTDMPVLQVMEPMPVLPNQVYLVPPDKHLLMIDGHITTSPNTTEEDRRAPVDIFFRTLAESRDSKAIAVILSGTGANGSMGLKRVKEQGGAVFVQNPREAEFNEMPRNAISTGLVDEVLPVSAIPKKIIAYKNVDGAVYIPVEAERRQEDQQQALREVFTQLRVRTGHDFSNYKRPTLLRRIERRINLRSLPDLPAYASLLQQNPDEITALLKDLLISVTNFFRDKKAFETLENEVLPVLLQNKTPEQQLRIWVAGCATGEEAYSIAMLCAEKTLNIIDAPKVQIFATDIDESAIAHAREGYYSLNDAADVSPERLRRFFIKEGDGYRIQREIREMILFANHNFIKDPPFSHLDMVSCRNVLIYLNHAAQERVMETFHFALNPAGFLFLGSSESVDGSRDMYAVFSRDQHIFQSRQVSARTYPVPESVPSFRFEQPNYVAPNQDVQLRTTERITFGELHQQLLEQYAPPSLVVNEEYDIVHLSERAGRYLQVAGGELSKHLLKLIRPELRLELRSALYQATQRHTAIEARGLKFSINDRTEMVNIHVRPVLQDGNTAKGFILVLFEQIVDQRINKEVLLSSDEPLARQLEEELIRLKAQLRTSIEQHEFQAEELKASNEELQAMNEELRSAAEELETSKEELQSINEELRTVNQELKVKIDETTLSGNNLQNLINSVDIGTVFLDRSFRVALFTPAARKIFNLIPADFGRPLSDITHRLEYNNIIADAEIVLEKLQTIEKEVYTTDGHVYMMRVLPYRTAEDRINGVVITFVNITLSKRAEIALRQSEQRYRTLFDSMDEGYCIIQILFDAKGQPNDFLYLEVNPAFEKHNGLENAEGKTIRQLAPDIEEKWIQTYAQVAISRQPLRFKDDSHALERSFDLYAFPVDAPEEHKVAVLFSNITSRQQTEKALLESEEKYRSLFASIDEGFAIVEMLYDKQGEPADYRFLETNPIFERQTGLAGATGKTVRELLQEPDQWWIDRLAAVLRTGEHTRFEIYLKVIGRWLDVFASPLGNDKQHRLALIFNDITERKFRETNISFLSELSNDFVHLSSPESIMQAVTTKLSQVFDANRVAFIHCQPHSPQQWYIYDRRLQSFEAVTGQYQLHQQLPATYLDALKQGRVLVHDRHEDLAMQPYSADYSSLNVRSMLLQPMIQEGIDCFILALQYDKPWQWRKDQLELAEDLTHRVFFRLERAFSDATMAADLRDMQLLRDLSTSVMTEDNIQVLYDQILTVAIGIMQAHAGTVQILNEQTSSLALIASKGIEEKVTSKFLQVDASPETAGGQILHSGQRTITNHSDSLQQAPASDNIAVQAGFIMSLATPLVTRSGRPIGVISTYWRQPHIATERELRFLDLLTRQAADLLEYRQAEISLRESEARFRTLTNAVPQVIWTNDSNGKATYFNDRWFAYSGLSPEESIGPGWQAIVHPDDAPSSKERWQEALDRGGVFDNEYRLRRADGVYRWHIGRNVPLHNKEGEVEGWFGSATDIEDLKMAQELVRKSKERLDVTMESVTDYAIITLNADGYIDGWNTGAVQIFGYQPEEVTGRPIDIIFTPEDIQAGMPERERQQARQEARAADERWHRRADGSLFFVSGVTMPIGEHAAGGYVKVARDMTSYKAAEEALRISEERYRAALQAAHMAAWDWDITSGKVTWNEEHYRMLGLEPDDAPKDVSFLFDFIHSQDQQMISDRLFNAATGDGVYHAEFRIIRADGETRWMNGYGRNVAWKDGKGVRMIGVMYDITERRMLEQQKEDFIGIASHELKTPVTSIKVYVEVLQEILEATNNIQSLELVMKLDRQVDRLIRLINDLLDNTKVSEGRLPLHKEQIDINALIGERLDDMRFISDRHKVVFEPSELPLVNADKERISQVITNLFSNAIKYSPAGGTVIISTFAKEEHVQVSVRDEGIGIPGPMIEKVFERFFQVSDPRMHSYPGMGLGLYITAGIIQHHNGTIRVESEVNKGTVFHFTIPVTNS